MMEIKEEVIGWVALQLNQLIVISAITYNVIDVSQEFSNDWLLVEFRASTA